MENESEKLSLIIEIFISGFTNKLIEITKTKNNILKFRKIFRDN